MADVGPPDGTGLPPGDASRPSPADVERWLGRWRQRLPGDPRLPEDEARLVLEAVLDDLSGGHPDSVDRAGWAWGRAHRSVSAMVGRLSALREAMAAGAVDEPLRMHRALDRLTAAATEEVLNRLERASRTDALTGVGNRRAFDETLSAALSAASRQGHDVTVVAVDLDGLKRINDTEGHAAGDAALLGLVRAMYSALRDEDTVFRLGGDEFVILLPFTSVGTAELLMERIQGAGAPAFTWGAAGFPGGGADARALVGAADADLYRRRQGRRPAVAALPAARPAPLRLGWLRAGWRWAWIPAAAVLVASLVATLVSGLSGPLVSSAGGRHHLSSPAPGQSGPRPTTGPAGGKTPVTSSTGGRGQVLYVNSTAPAGTSGSSGPGTTPSPPGSSGPSSPPGSTGPPAGGLLGTLEQIASPVPIVGGNNGLLATLGQILTGTTYASPAATAPAATAPVSAAPAGSVAVTSPPATTPPATTRSGGGLLGLLGLAHFGI